MITFENVEMWEQEEVAKTRDSIDVLMTFRVTIRAYDMYEHPEQKDVLLWPKRKRLRLTLEAD